MEKKYGVVALGDIVWNHTSHDTPWIGEHPEVAYNTDNCSYLKPAAVVDIVSLNVFILVSLIFCSRHSTKWLRILLPESIAASMD